ncbi:LytR/AlgR family response regulator transcription factor [Larkinella rosea]|uniref:DNA-binding response regulator n=1 Tax=Larkinella rosea TaxID=2025312 RepID=A0A3P1C0J2_9BACT|nr:LytTR family DNA-binding domain-containing protein [Larkinella rosea]RRB06646.1 DNA-binding response regulator [Larkinella rosea]
MRVLIIEDEVTAASHLSALLREIEPSLTVLGVIDSVSEGREKWLEFPVPDLIFSDIQLADGLSFTLLEQVAVSCPIIFTTAYDEYAIRAFRHNSIDYLLKPIEREALETALQKYRSLNRPVADDLVRQMREMLSSRAFQPRTYRTNFLIQFRDKLLPIKVSDIAYFEIEGGVVSATLLTKIRYPIDLKLDELENQLNPQDFFRANRQFIISRKCILEVELYFNGRLQVQLIPMPGGAVVISKDRAPQFKKWLEEF